MTLTVAKIRELLSLAGYTGLSRLRNKSELVNVLDHYLNGYKYAPRYLRGLSPEEKREKKFDIRYYILTERKTGKPHYEPIQTDRDRQVKVSRYTAQWYKHFPNAHSLAQKSEVSGVPVDILHRIDSKGRAAWRGGQHRPGAGQAQWGIARVNSFLTCGKTYHTADRVLATEATRRSGKARRHFAKMCR